MQITRKSGCDNARADLLLVTTFLSILILVMVMVGFHVDGNSALGGTLIILIGKFASMIGTAFDFEFGSSRSDQAKDATIAAASKGQVITATADAGGAQVTATAP